MAVDEPLYVLFVDLKKAYDSVPLQNLRKALERYNISSNIIREIKSLYEKSISKIKIRKQLSSGFYITKELRLPYLKYIFKMLWKIGRRNVQRWDWKFRILQFIHCYLQMTNY